MLCSSRSSAMYVASGTFDVPAGVSLVWVTMVGGGGGGAGGHATGVSSGSGGGGGGSGEFVMNLPVNVTPGASITVTIGDGGTGGAATTIGGDGGDTSFGSLKVRGGCGGGVSYINNIFSFNRGGDGGGRNGGEGIPPINTASHLPIGVPGGKDSPTHHGGSAGGCPGNGGNAWGRHGGSCLGFLGGNGAKSYASFHGGGGGGAASIFGPGGDGGAPARAGMSPPSWAYGAGGGGGGAVNVGTVGADGVGGCCIVYWVEKS